MHLHTIVFLFFIQFFAACQQDPKQVRISEARLGFSSDACAAQDMKAAPPSAANIVF